MALKAKDTVGRLAPCQRGVRELSTNCKITISERVTTCAGARPADTRQFESGMIVVGIRRWNVVESVFIFVRQRKIGHLHKVYQPETAGRVRDGYHPRQLL